MATKKTSIFRTLAILNEYSDEHHPLTHKEIGEKHQALYDETLDRKTISDNINSLLELDYDIVQNGKNKGVYLASNVFEQTQVQYLMDAVYSSKSISGKDADELLDKLASFLSKYQRQKYPYIKKSSTVNRSNSKLFSNIDIVNQAINENKTISFQYSTYNKEGKLVPTKSGYVYPNVSPYYLINNFGKYYLLGKYYNSNTSSTFRLDYMTEINILDQARTPIREVKDLGESFKVSDYINNHIYIFSGEAIQSVIEIENEYNIRDVKDWFGNNAKFFTKDDKCFARITCNKNALLYWALQYIKGIKIISPRSLQDEIIAVLKSSLNTYNELSSNNTDPLVIDTYTYYIEYVNEIIGRSHCFKELSEEDLYNDFINYIDMRNETSILNPRMINNELYITNKEDYRIIVKHFTNGISQEDYDEIVKKVSSPLSTVKNTFLVLFNKMNDVESPNCFRQINDKKIVWRGLPIKDKVDWYKYTIIKF